MLAAACARDRTGGAIGPGEGPAHPNVGHEAPEFLAEDLAGPWLALSSLKDRSVALLLFRSGAPLAPEMVREFGLLRDDPSLAPTVFLGIDNDSLDGLRQFVRVHRTSLPVLRDPGSIARAYGARELPTVVLIDSDHIVRFQLDGFLGNGFRSRLEATVAFLRTLPRIAKDISHPLDFNYMENPRAPLFKARDLDGRTVDLAELRGRVVVLSFFDQECPHCKKDLPLLAAALREFRGRGVLAFGITSRDAGGGLHRYLKDQGVDYPVIVDSDRALFDKYESTRTPDTFFIDKDGFVRFHEQGDRPDRDDLTRMQLRILLGDSTPTALAASLPKDRYVGDGLCRSCHAREYRDWLFTPHSIAWDSLQRGEKWRDKDCVGCHVTGRGHPGGFTDAEATSQLVNVQCEVCHGPGGGHASGTRLDTQAIGRVCATCHNGKFVLNFNLDEALALVAHRDHPDMEKLFHYSGLQRQRLEEMNTRRLEKFRSGVEYVGVEACRDCHRAEYEQWNRTPHAAAFAPLLQQGRGADKGCSPCHTTGMGSKGGFGTIALNRGPMTNVQCEVCHGPGGDHVKAPRELKKATIYGITDQCSFCIIQGLCATCHDRANDPHFDIERALPLVKHRPAPR